jgi:hypothetical protein
MKKEAKMTESDFLRRSLTTEMPTELLLQEHHLQRVNSLARRRSRNRRAAAAAGGLAVVSAIGIGGASLFTSAPEAIVADNSSQIEPPSSPMPEPWSDVAIDSPEWLPDNAFLVTGGQSPDGPWQVVSARLAADEEGCLLKADPASMGDTHGVCFDTWPAGEAIQHRTWPLTTTQTLVIGAVSANARTVRVDLSDGTSVTTNAVATPSSNVLRYFVVPVSAESVVEDAVGLASDGELSPPPPGLPWSDSCTSSDPSCPTKGG